jgi:hypothetical protein
VILKIKKSFYSFLLLSVFISGCAVTPKPLAISPRPAPVIDVSGKAPRLEKKVLVISASDFEKISQFSINRGASTSTRSYESRLFNRVYSNLERKFLQSGITPISTLSATSNIGGISTKNNNPLANLENTHILVLREISVNWSSQRIGSIGQECYYPVHIVPLTGLLDAQLISPNGQLLWTSTVRYDSSSNLKENHIISRERCDRPINWNNPPISLCAENNQNECKIKQLSDEHYDKATTALTNILFSKIIGNNND